jgi:GWxTD domain-containing protein
MMGHGIRNAVATVAVVLMAASAFAALSQEYVDFGKSAAQYFMTQDELAKWKTIDNDTDAKAFIDLFWLRHDPSPGTPANEFRTVIEQRVKFADDTFSTRRTRGSMTDRGHTCIVLGNPTEKVKQEYLQAAAVPGVRDTAADETGAAQPEIGAPMSRGLRQIWTYDPDKIVRQVPTAALTALGPSVLTIAFTDPTGSGDFRFERSRTSPPYNELLQNAAAAYLAQPNVTSLTQQTTTTRTTTTTVTKGEEAKPPAGTIKTAALQAAVGEVKAGKSAVAKNAAFAYAELVSPAGDYYVPIQLYLPKSIGLTADAADTFFGVVEDASGTQVYAFEEPAKLTASQGDLFVDRTLDLPSGKYTAIVGLAKAGVPVIMTSNPLDLTQIAKDATGTSKLVLSNNMYDTPEAAPVKSPFAFGKLKIVPKADLVFSNKDELTYFIELHNPGLADVPVGPKVKTTTTVTGPGTATSISEPAETVKLPKIQSKVELSGGKLTKPIGAPLSDVDALPLSGAPGPGQYAVISSIQFARMSKPLDPGDYTLKVKLIDTINKQTYTVSQSFKITAP